jgi:hypothetical protein
MHGHAQKQVCAMNTHLTRTAALISALITATSPALAQSDLQPGFDTRLLALAPAVDKAESCYLRRYDSAHLKAHPRQRVETIGLCIDVERILPEEKADPVRYRYNFDFAAKLKGRAKPATTGGECGFAYVPLGDQPLRSDKGIHCGVDCDGGGITVEARKGGAELLVRLDRIRVAGGCGGDDDESKAFDITSGVDDKVFLIPRTSTEHFQAFMRN